MHTEPYFFLDPEILEGLAQRSHQTYVQLNPSPHIVLDDFLPGEVADRLLAEFPKQALFQDNNDPRESRRKGKFISTDERLFGGFTRHVLYYLNSYAFIAFLEKLSGIQGLIPDPDIGQALRHFARGGYLGVHTDFNWHPKLRLDRRLNLILYLNKGWKEEYGGSFEFWSADMACCVKRILPVFNRCIIFTTTDSSPHGFPDPLACPEGETRKSLQLYYYTSGHSTSEIGRTTSTQFRWRPQERWSKERVSALSIALMKKIIPPDLLGLARRFRRPPKGDV